MPNFKVLTVLFAVVLSAICFVSSAAAGGRTQVFKSEQEYTPELWGERSIQGGNSISYSVAITNGQDMVEIPSEQIRFSTDSNLAYFRGSELISKPVTAKETVAVKAVYIWQGKEYSGEYNITLFPNPLDNSAEVQAEAAPVLSSIEIRGADFVLEDRDRNYYCVATYSDGSRKNVTQLTDWILLSSLKAPKGTMFLPENKGLLHAGWVDGITPISIRAKYIENGRVCRLDKTINIVELVLYWTPGFIPHDFQWYPELGNCYFYISALMGDRTKWSSLGWSVGTWSENSTAAEFPYAPPEKNCMRTLYVYWNVSFTVTYSVWYHSDRYEIQTPFTVTKR